MLRTHWPLIPAIAAALIIVGCEDTSTQTPDESAQQVAPDKDYGEQIYDQPLDQVEDTSAQLQEQAEALTSRANELLDDAQRQIDSGNYDQAELTLQQLEQLDVSQSVQVEVAELRERLQQAYETESSAAGQPSGGSTADAPPQGATY